jgi:uncharacterized membrane protein SpoIIM required for sporulation/ABC-type transport system involved in multi-copper enzyme maturation permease subunit
MSQWQRTLLVMRRELRDSLSDWRIVTPVVLLTFIFPWLVIYASKFGINYITYIERNPGLVLTQLIPFAAMVVGFFPISFSLVIALESFVGEKERNTLEALLATPATDGALYVGKLLAALALPLSGSMLAVTIYAIGLPWITGQYVAPDVLLQIILLIITLALGMVAGAVVVSSNTTSVRAANLLASFIVIPAMLLLQMQAMVILWQQRHVLWLIVAAQVLIDLALIRMGIRLFNREDLLARTLDRIDLRRTWRTFWSFLKQEPGAALARRPSARLTLGRLYRRDIPQVLRRSGGAIVVVLLVIGGAFAVGWGFAWSYPVPAASIGLDNLTAENMRAGLARIPGIFGMPPLDLFLWNLRAVSLSTLGGIVSFGAMAVMPLFLVSGLLGYLLGHMTASGMNVVPLLAAVLPHGLLEVPAALLAAAAGLRMGAMVLSPPRGFTLGETLLLGLADFVKVFIFLVVPLLLVAAFVEIYVTPQVVLWVLGG